MKKIIFIILSMLFLASAASFAEAATTTTYYPSGLIESVTFDSPDPHGNIYYHYLDEDWLNQGMGRMDKRISALPEGDGARAFTYEYFNNIAPQICIERHYQNTDFTRLIAQYEYRPKDGYITTWRPIFISEDVFVADFGAMGLMKYDNGTWSQIVPWDPYIFSWGSPSSILIGFEEHGLYKYENNALTQILSWEPYNIMWVSGADMVVDFGPAHGLWYFKEGAWSQLWPESLNDYMMSSTSAGFQILTYTESAGLILITESGVTQFPSSYPYPQYVYGFNGVYYIDFGSSGLWRYESGVFTQLSQWDPDFIESFWDNASGSLISLIDFGSNGLWRYAEGGNLTLILAADAVKLIGSFIDLGEAGGLWLYDAGTITQVSSFGGVYDWNIISVGTDTVIDFGPSRGIWKYSGGTMSKISDIGGADSWGCSNINGAYTLTMNFGDDNGIWAYDGTSWSQLSVYGWEGVYGAGQDTYYDLGSHGLWKYSGGAMTQIAIWNPIVLSFDYGALMADFGAHGLYIYDGAHWTLLHAATPSVQNSSPTGDVYIDGKTYFIYWNDDPDSPVRYALFYDALDIWDKTIEYYEDGIVMHRQWIADQNTQQPGNAIYEEYDTDGRITYKVFDAGDSIIYMYDGASTIRYFEIYLTSAGQWQKTIQYYPDGVKIHYQWFAAIDPAQKEMIFEERDETSLNRIRKTVYDTGEMVFTEYAGDTAAKQYDIFLDASGQWQKTIEYNSDGLTMLRQWFVDTAATDETLYEEYDSEHRVVYKRLDTGMEILVQYYAGTNNRQYDIFINASGWQKTIGYREDGITMRYQWIADANPGASGDEIYYEYDSDERLIRIGKDDGSFKAFEYLTGTTTVTKIVNSEPDQNDVIVYEYFYDLTGAGGSIQLVRERRYYGDGSNGIVREYVPGETLPVKIIDRENGLVYRKVSGDGSSLTLKVRYYEDSPESGYPWGSFDFGQTGENVYVKDVMVGTHLKERFFFVSSADLDLDTGINWGAAVKRTPEGHDWSTPIEIDVPKYSMYEIEPHWAAGEPDKPLDSFPFTYYASGRVKTWFEHTVHEGWFTRSEEATGRVYEYADETFYAEESVGALLAGLIYSAKGALSDCGLKYFLSQIDPGNFSTVASLREHLYNNASGENNYTTGDVSDTFSRMLLAAPYEAHGRLLKVTDPDGTYRVFEYDGDTGTVSAIKTYDIQGRLLEERVSVDPDKEYISMGSLPWVRYGEQLGTRWYDGWHGGFSKGRSGSEELTGYEELRATMKKWAGSQADPGYVRLFLMSDLRAGVVFDANGVPTGFTDHVYEDMDVLLQVAAELNVKLIPVLFDYRIADGYSDSIERDFPGFFTDQTLYNGKTKAEWLVELFRPFIAAYGNNENIYAWDVINEPEMMGEDRQGSITGITMDEVTSFVRKFVEMIHEETYDLEAAAWAKVTVGSLTKGDMAKYWIGPDNALAPGDLRALDLYQFHYYDSSSLYHNADFESLGYGKGMLNTLSALNDGLIYFYAPTYVNTKQVICGELDPAYVQDKLDTLANGDYDGMIFWDDKGNMLSAREYQDAREWTYGIVATYDPLTGNVVSYRGPDIAGTGIIYYHYDSLGRVDSVIKKYADEYGAIAYTYEYHEGTSMVSTEKAYHEAKFDVDAATPSLAKQVYEKNYGIDGSQSGATEWTRTYYEDTWYASSETLQEADDYGVTYRKYLNEARNTDPGREDIEYHPGWGYAYQLQYLGDSYTRIGAFKYSGIDISSPSNPILTGFSGYETWSSGIETISYYDQALNIIESRTFSGADNSGNVYYHYLNDNWHNAATNYMRMDSCRRAEANEKGELAFSLVYFGGDDATSINSVFSYSDAGMTDLIAEYDFDTAGRIITSRLFGGPNANGESAFTYEYYGLADGGGYHLVTSYDSTDISDENKLAIYEYSTEGELIGYTYPASSSNSELLQNMEVAETVIAQFSDHFANELADPPATQELLTK